MTKYRRKMTDVDALQFTGENFFVCLQFIGAPDHLQTNLELKTTDCPIVHTLDGPVTVRPKNWIVKDATGILHMFTDAKFKELYDIVEP